MYLDLSFFNDADGINRGSFNGFSASALSETIYPDVAILAGESEGGKLSACYCVTLAMVPHSLSPFSIFPRHVRQFRATAPPQSEQLRSPSDAAQRHARPDAHGGTHAYPLRAIWALHCSK